MLFPASLMFVVRFLRRYVTQWLVVATVLSLGLCIYATPRHAAVAFYMLPTRVWELLMGAALASYRCLPQPGGRRIQSIESADQRMVRLAGPRPHSGRLHLHRRGGRLPGVHSTSAHRRDSTSSHFSEAGNAREQIPRTGNYGVDWKTFLLPLSLALALDHTWQNPGEPCWIFSDHRCCVRRGRRYYSCLGSLPDL